MPRIKTTEPKTIEDGFYLKSNHNDKASENITQICAGTEWVELRSSFFKNLSKKLDKIAYPTLKYLTTKLLKDIAVKFIIVFNKEFFRRENLSDH